MRYQELLELTGVKKYHDMTASEVMDQFRSVIGQSNIKLLGQGANGAALLINNTVYKFWLLDSAYTAFVKYCNEHTSNPCLPKFLSGIKKMPAFFVRHANAPDYVNFIKMEKLTTNRHILQYRFDLNYQPYEKAFDEIDDGESDITGITLATALYYFDRLQDSEIPPLTQFTQYLSRYHKMKYNTDILGKELTVFLNTLWDIKQLGFTLDLHDENFIMRDDQLVILDPIANVDDLNLNRAFYKFDEKLFRDEGEGKPAMKSSRSSSNKNLTPTEVPDNTSLDDLDTYMKGKDKT